MNVSGVTYDRNLTFPLIFFDFQVIVQIFTKDISSASSSSALQPGVGFGLPQIF
jgi:hypothetical protein